MYGPPGVCSSSGLTCLFSTAEGGHFRVVIKQFTCGYSAHSQILLTCIFIHFDFTL
uniref:Uncharacterized protein n=1 Tax=Anguilla anguilla TaxID=7936 RepID=A0A0E9PEF2_ANGAN